MELSFPPDLDSVPADCEVLSVFLGMPVDGGFLDRHPGLRAVMTRSHSVDHIDAEACRARGIRIWSLPPYGTRSVAEHTFALLLTLSRRIRETVGSARGPAFSYAATRGFELAGKTLGLVGLGRVGTRVARIGLGFGMRVLACDPEARPVAGVRMASLETVLGRARILSLHAKLTPENRHLLNRETLGLCRRGVILLNTARGGLVDLQALREALQSGQVGGAGLDVLEEERLLHDTAAHVLSDEILDRLRTGPARSPERLQRLRELVWSDCVLSRQNVIFTPHVGFNSEESARRVRHLTVRCLRRWVLEAPIGGPRARPPPRGGVAGPEWTGIELLAMAWGLRLEYRATWHSRSGGGFFWARNGTPRNRPFRWWTRTRALWRRRRRWVGRWNWSAPWVPRMRHLPGRGGVRRMSGRSCCRRWRGGSGSGAGSLRT